MRLLFFISLISCYILSSCGSISSEDNQTSTDSAAHRTEKDDRPAEEIELTKKIQSSPSNPSFYNDRAKYYIRQKKYDDAWNDLKVVFTLDSTNSKFYNTLADYHTMQAEPRKAELALQRALQINPKSVTNLLKLAELYYFGKKRELSFKYINEALRINKYEAEAYYLKGMNYKEMKDTNRAISGFQTAIEQNPDYYDAYIQLALIHTAQKNKLAIDYYTSALKVKPNSTEALYGRGYFYQSSGANAKALADYKKITELEPANYNAWYNTGVVFYNENKADTALMNFNKAIKSDAQHAEAYAMRGLCSEALGKKEEAASDYELALNLKPELAMAREGLRRVK